MTNFDFLKREPKFARFADAAISAEKIINIDVDASVLNCRRAMEFAVKWMYSVDDSLTMPYRDTLSSLMNAEEFRNSIDADLWKRMDLIRRLGNQALLITACFIMIRIAISYKIHKIIKIPKTMPPLVHHNLFPAMSRLIP